MLSMAALTVGQEEYHLALTRGDYYAAGAEAPGRWWGRGASQLGLEGRVRGEELRSLFRGLAPDDSRKLVQNAGARDRQPAWDLTFSCPKSVSAVWAVARTERRLQIEACQAEAVAAALAYLERVAAFSRRGHGGEEREPCGLVVAAFAHATSRAGDPQLHTHCLVVNAAARADGTTGTIESRPLYRHKMAAGALYRATLAALLEQRTGLRCTRHQSWFEVDGVPRGLIAELSGRRGAIEAALAEAAAEGPVAAALAALATRPARPNLTHQELQSRWQEAARRHAFSEERLEAPAGQPTRKDADGLLREALDLALGRLTARQAYFARPDLVRYVAEESQGRGLGAAVILEGVERCLAGELVPLGPPGGEERFTTREMLALEARLLEAVEQSRACRFPTASPETVRQVLARYPALTGEQVQAVAHVTRPEGAIHVIAGMAGTGKTTVLAVVREVHEREGFTVLGVALAGKAAQGLEEGAGIRSSTLHRLLRGLGEGSLAITPRTVVILDEASMVGTRQFEGLVRQVVIEGGGKLILVGDARQLPSIDAGGGFAAVARRLGEARLTRITRQREAWAREAVRHFAEGRAALALKTFAEHGLLTVCENRAGAPAALVSDWAASGGAGTPREHLILAGTSRDVTILNRLAREERRREGLLGAEYLSVEGEVFHAGDRVLCTRNDRLLGVRNGQLGQVLALDAVRRHLVVQLDGGAVVLLPVDTYPHLKLGYAVTTHKSQGATVEHAYVLVGGPMTDRELSYVQASRARWQTRLYVEESEAGEELAALARQMGRSRAKHLAHDVGAPLQTPLPEPLTERGD
jgi:Ti-type conjugative transfer relaxase TraA